MKMFRNIFGNGWALAGIVAYGASLALLWPNKSFGHGDAIVLLLIFGVAFPVLAWLTTLRAKPLAVTTHRNVAEIWLLFACLVMVTLYLIWGATISETFVPAKWFLLPRARFFVVLVRKLIVFVVIPFLLFRFIFGYRWRDYGVQWAGLRAFVTNHLPVVLALSAAILIFQYFLGGGAAPVRHGEFNARELIIALPLCFAWLFIEAGLVEEFFFRALVQERLAAWFKSEVSGVALMALLFGLAHAPGFIFRHAGLEEAIGPNPSAADSIAYSIVILSVSGIFFGVVWARTKNLFAVMFIHAATDVLPNLKDFVETWGI
ncbi:MAG: CPBP family intramembrane glutamic endopeptidase [Chthoniobacterales bacterium]